MEYKWQSINWRDTCLICFAFLSNVESQTMLPIKCLEYSGCQQTNRQSITPECKWQNQIKTQELYKHGQRPLCRSMPQLYFYEQLLHKWQLPAMLTAKGLLKQPLLSKFWVKFDTNCSTKRQDVCLVNEGSIRGKEVRVYKLANTSRY